jgi:hypothetical protein
VKTTNLHSPLIRWKVAIWFLIVPFVLTLIGAVLSIRPAASAQLTDQAIIIIATPTAQLPVAQPIASQALIGYFDFSNLETATPLTSADVVWVVGQFGDWRLVETQAGARVWLRITDVPANVPSDSPLADLTPPTAQPAPILAAAPAVAPVDNTPDCGPHPGGGDKWVCSTDGRGWILPGIEDWLATAPAPEPTTAPVVVMSAPAPVKACGGPRSCWRGR